MLDIGVKREKQLGNGCNTVNVVIISHWKISACRQRSISAYLHIGKYQYRHILTA